MDMTSSIDSLSTQDTSLTTIPQSYSLQTSVLLVMEPTTVKIMGNAVKPEAQQEGGEYYVRDASATNYILIQCVAPVEKAQRSELARHQVELQHTFESTYICKYEPNDLELLRRLPFLHYANAFHQAYKVDHYLKHNADVENNQVIIVPHLDRENLEGLKNLIEKIALLLAVDKSTIHYGREVIQMSLSREEIDVVASLDEVYSIETDDEIETYNWTAREDLEVLQPGATPQWFPHQRYTASTENVAVADKGISANHPAFKRVGRGALGTRVTAVSWRQDGSVNDFDAHGTHVAASVAGN